jgi:hypothetical protein
MKKILVSALLLIAGCSFGQQYPVNSNYGNSENSYNYNNGNYDYPDDYYYDFPTDYYPQTYYESYYNDYRKSIISINWSRFFRQYRLNRYQIEQIIYLNNLYQSFANWNSFYGVNPDRWYYDRFYALQNILGPQIFISFQNNYYQGYNPIVHFQNYRRTYYTPRFHVNTQYRNVNITKYRVDRNTYKDPRANNGLYDPNHRNNTNGLQQPNSGNGGFRSGVKAEVAQPTRNILSSESTRDNGFRSGVKIEATQPIRNISPAENPRSNGFRSVNNNENTSQKPQISTQRRNESGLQNGKSVKTEVSTNRKVENTQRFNDSRGGGFR